jgi:hypothetical protein
MHLVDQFVRPSDRSEPLSEGRTVWMFRVERPGGQQLYRYLHRPDIAAAKTVCLDIGGLCRDRGLGVRAEDRLRGGIERRGCDSGGIVACGVSIVQNGFRPFCRWAVRSLTGCRSPPREIPDLPDCRDRKRMERFITSPSRCGMEGEEDRTHLLV